MTEPAQHALVPGMARLASDYGGVATLELLEDDALTIYTDGSSYSNPRRGGIGYRFVWTAEDGHEAVYDSDSSGFEQATNNQMEIKAAVEALREAVATWSPVDVAHFRKIVIYSDSEYLVSGYQSARYRWPQDGWMTAPGRPVENAELWQELLKAAHNTGRRVDLKWIPGKKGLHARAVDKLAKASAQGFLNEPLGPSRVRRSRNPGQFERGSVGIEGQVVTIYVRTDRFMPVQRCYRYRYEVVDEDSPYDGLVDDLYSDREILLSAGHTYTVRVNDVPGDPRVVEVLEEVISSDADR